ncbi:thermonuclease family protein [Actinomycetospora sp. OC33-EN08]|uniref:Thermonuclease family protein n=1 Tax=Actinomycetospora aurantiaca TaxID=3129233 RepID=A0ABU8MG60_9PSEU
MTTGTAPRVLLALACLAGLLGAVAVLSGAVATGPSVTAGPPATPTVSPAAAPGALRTAPTGEPATVLAVSDPVTVDVRLEGGRVLRVRALGVQPPGRCYADEALQFARTTLAGKAVTLVGDGRSDRFSRALAWVSLPQGEYAVLAAEAGVVTTYAADTPAARMPAVRAAADRAEEAGRGVWRACGS